MSEYMAISLGMSALTAVLFWIGLTLYNQEGAIEVQVIHFAGGYFFFLGTLFTIGKIAEQAELSQISLAASGIFWIGIIVFAAIVMYVIVTFGKSSLQKIADEYPEEE